MHSFQEVGGYSETGENSQIYMHSLRMNVPMLKHLPILIVYIFLTPLNYWLGGVILIMEAFSARLTHSQNDPMP